METMVKEEDLEDQVQEDIHLNLVIKDQVDLVMLEVSHHQKETMVEVEPTLITGVEVVAVAFFVKSVLLPPPLANEEEDALAVAAVTTEPERRMYPPPPPRPFLALLRVAHAHGEEEEEGRKE